MTKKLLSVAAILAAVASTATAANAADVLTGDTRLACEAILCLSSGTRPSECTPSLRRYFSINHRKVRDTIRARHDFLELCPASNQTPEMQALVSAIAAGAGRCDAASLNIVLVSYTFDDRTYISDQLPEYCSAYANHPYTDFDGTMPRYVGEPLRGGYWVEAKDYDKASADYQARIRCQNEGGTYEGGVCTISSPGG